MIKLILVIFLVFLSLDLALLVGTNYSEMLTKSANEVAPYFVKLIGAWLAFSILFGSAIFFIRWIIRKWGKNNSHLDKAIFYLITPLVFCMIILTAIGLQLRFFGGFFFPANFSENFFTIFGLSMGAFFIGLILLGLKIFVIKPSVLNEVIISSPLAPKNIFTPQLIFQRVLPVIIGLAVMRRYGLMSGLTAYMGILIAYELVLWVWGRRHNR